MQLDTWLIQRNIANAIRFSSIREHLRLTPMLFWFAMPVWQAFCVIQMSVAKTIRYLQSHFVCAKLFVVVSSFFIDKSSICVFCFDWQVSSILTQMEDFVHRLTYFEPRDYRVVFVIQF